jgi:hypothetical protein
LPTTFKIEAFKVKNCICSEISSASAGATRNYTLDSEPESKEALPEPGKCTREDQDLFSLQYH